MATEPGPLVPLDEPSKPSVKVGLVPLHPLWVLGAEDTWEVKMTIVSITVGVMLFAFTVVVELEPNVPVTSIGEPVVITPEKLAMAPTISSSADDESV